MQDTHFKIWKNGVNPKKSIVYGGKIEGIPCNPRYKSRHERQLSRRGKSVLVTRDSCVIPPLAQRESAACLRKLPCFYVTSEKVHPVQNLSAVLIVIIKKINPV